MFLGIFSRKCSTFETQKFFLENFWLLKEIKCFGWHFLLFSVLLANSANTCRMAPNLIKLQLRKISVDLKLICKQKNKPHMCCSWNIFLHNLWLLHKHTDNIKMFISSLMGAIYGSFTVTWTYLEFSVETLHLSILKSGLAPPRGLSLPPIPTDVSFNDTLLIYCPADDSDGARRAEWEKTVEQRLKMKDFINVAEIFAVVQLSSAKLDRLFRLHL